jgi:dihydroxyacid dehydratase/phosphogluconate dehydratase
MINTFPAPSTGLTSAIASVQYFTKAFAASSSVTQTITSVNTAKSVIVILGALVTSSTATPDNYLAQATLTNATTVTLTRGGSTNVGLSVGFVVVEFV